MPTDDFTPLSLHAAGSRRSLARLLAGAHDSNLTMYSGGIACEIRCIDYRSYEVVTLFVLVFWFILTFFAEELNKNVIDDETFHFSV